MSVTDHYAVLGLAFGASFEEIKKAHKKMALKHHPDKNVGSVSASGKFVQIQEAYEALESRRSDELNRGGVYKAFAQQAQAKSLAEVFAEQQRRTAAAKLLEEVRERKRAAELFAVQQRQKDAAKFLQEVRERKRAAELFAEQQRQKDAAKLLEEVRERKLAAAKA